MGVERKSTPATASVGSHEMTPLPTSSSDAVVAAGSGACGDGDSAGGARARSKPSRFLTWPRRRAGESESESESQANGDDGSQYDGPAVAKNQWPLRQGHGSKGSLTLDERKQDAAEEKLRQSRIPTARTECCGRRCSISLRWIIVISQVLMVMSAVAVMWGIWATKLADVKRDSTVVYSSSLVASFVSLEGHRGQLDGMGGGGGEGGLNV